MSMHTKNNTQYSCDGNIEMCIREISDKQNR
ncbi:protein phosphatase 2C domain-containing protein, partial [Bacillus cereus]|nr:protein phosphatase 2C domain-containing protein [Bacillus cereus]